MPERLEIMQIGNPILREMAKRLTVEEIVSREIKELVETIRYTNQQAKAGVGLAAPQVGVSVALSVIGVKPTPNRPELEPFEQVIINPEYEGLGDAVGMWEGCQSCCHADLFAQAMRYPEIDATWHDEQGEPQKQRLGGFVAQVFQHETDHLNGVLFVDRVGDSHTFMTSEEYRERIIKG